MAVLPKIKSHSGAIDYLKELWKKTLKKHWWISWTSFLWATERNNQAFRGYAMSYKVEIIEKKDPMVQLEASKSSIKDLFSCLLNEKKGFKYQITVKVCWKNTSPMEKLNLLQVILIHWQKQ